MDSGGCSGLWYSRIWFTRNRNGPAICCGAIFVPKGSEENCCLIDPKFLPYFCTVQVCFRLFAALMAFLISVTSLGIAVSAHTCSESGFSETSLKPLKICCKLPDGKGFQSEPCCKLTVKHIKLPTVRTVVSSVHVPFEFQMPHVAMTVPPTNTFEEPRLTFRSGHDPPDFERLASGRAIQTQFCAFLI